MLVSISMVFANIPIEAYASTNSVSVNNYHSNNATNIDAATAANNMKTVKVAAAVICDSLREKKRIFAAARRLR